MIASMAFVFSQVEPRETGVLSHPDVDIGRYLEVSADQGFHDQMFAVAMRMTEDQIYKEGPVLQPDELNKKYGIAGNLHFDAPEYESIARLRNNRKQSEMDREYYLSQGNHGFFSGRGIAGLGVSLATSMANPLDLALAFMPVTGSVAAANRARVLGQGGMRQAIAHGLITEEAIASRVPAPKFFSAMINGTVTQAAIEIPLAIQNYKDQANYGPENFITDIALGGAFSGGIHLTADLLGRAFRKIRGAAPEVQETMFRQALQQSLRDEDVHVAEYVNLDEGRIRGQVDAALKLKALDSIDMPKLQEEVTAKFKERVVGAAIKYSDGEVREGTIHALIDGPTDDAGAREGFVTDKGRFVSREEAAQITGHSHDSLGSEDILAAKEFATATGSQIDLPPEARGSFTPQEAQVLQSSIREGRSFEQGMQDVQEFRKSNEAQAQQNLLNRPDVQTAIEAEKSARIEKFLQENRPEAIKQAHDAEIRQQVDQGKILRPEDAKKWTHTLDDGGKGAIDEDAKMLQAEVESMLKDAGGDPAKLREQLKELEDRGVGKEALAIAIDCLTKRGMV